ncbi:MAG TPA: hypothetical protein VGR90_05695, partial [Acidimicrobiales bacterium]|nr:hypothetical protein [Acidimicrobiales bacterium]
QQFFDVQQVGITFCLWLIVCMVGVLARPTYVNGQATQARGVQGLKPAGALGIIFAIVMGAYALYLSQKPNRADLSFQAATNLEASLPQAPSADKTAVAVAATEAIQDAMSLNGWQPRYALSFAEGLTQGALNDPAGSPQQVQDLRAANNAYRQVLSLEPNDPLFLEEYGRFLLSVKDASSIFGPSSSAAQVLRRAHELNPLNPEVAHLLDTAEASVAS